MGPRLVLSGLSSNCLLYEMAPQFIMTRSERDTSRDGAGSKRYMSFLHASVRLGAFRPMDNTLMQSASLMRRNGSGLGRRRKEWKMASRQERDVESQRDSSVFFRAARCLLAYCR